MASIYETLVFFNTELALSSFFRACRGDVCWICLRHSSDTSLFPGECFPFWGFSCLHPAFSCLSFFVSTIRFRKEKHRKTLSYPVELGISWGKMLKKEINAVDWIKVMLCCPLWKRSKIIIRGLKTLLLTRETSTKHLLHSKYYTKHIYFSQKFYEVSVI